MVGDLCKEIKKNIQENQTIKLKNMKTNVKKWMGIAMLFIAATAVSCNDDTAKPDREEGFVIVRDDLKGEIAAGEHVVLENGTYRLTGRLVVRDGGKLTVKPGVTIEATPVASSDFGSVRYIAVAQGGQIFVEGTAAQPVVMTAAEEVPGAWGGLVLAGRAPINKGATAQAEVSDLTYGGTDVHDNSGSIRYLRIEYSGFSYNSEKEFNGLSMFGVGKGTTIEYVQVYEGSDDGFEWFGGTVDARYLVVNNISTEVGDDLFDWTEGWNGTGEYWYGIRMNDGNRGIEADNNGNNHLADPISNPTIKNLTLIGNGTGGPEPQAIKLRVGTKANFDNVVLKNWKTGFDVQHDEGIAYVADGSLKATNVRFENVETKSVGKNTAGVESDITAMFTENPAATGAGNGADVPAWAQGWTVGL